MSHRVHILCPDQPQPSGGVRQLYRLADFLNAQGHRATIWHRTPGFKLSWFQHSTPIEYGPNFNFAATDWAVIPESWAFDLLNRLPGVRKVIFNQNAYFTFANSRLSPDGVSPYLDPELKATIVVSDDSARYLQHAFPRAKIYRHFYDCDPDNIWKFVPQDQKRPRISFMPRKYIDHATQVFQILYYRGALQGWQIHGIDNVAPPAVADALSESAFFFSFGYPEGFGLPPAEAILSGCVVVGYHGNAGREFMTPDKCYPIEVGQILEFARVAEDALKRWGRDRAPFAETCIKARDHIRATYNAQTEKASLERIWTEIFAAG